MTKKTDKASLLFKIKAIFASWSAIYLWIRHWHSTRRMVVHGDRVYEYPKNPGETHKAVSCKYDPFLGFVLVCSCGWDTNKMEDLDDKDD